MTNPVQRGRVLVRVSFMLGVLVLAGCATTVPPNAGQNSADPFERANRHVDAFNQRFDNSVMQPVARGYVAVVPKPMRNCVDNFFENLAEIRNGFNAGLQGKPREAGQDVARLLINSTVGVAGCFDVAGAAGLERKRQNFGITLGVWGLTPGPYLVLPFLGPSTVRQSAGLMSDYLVTDPVGYVKPSQDAYELTAGRLVSDRAVFLDITGFVNDAALDPYAFVRDGYLQRLDSRVHDGNAAPPSLDDDPDAPDPAVPVKKGNKS
jgi:phospholipid-binding lipoprotein MlaA